MSAAQQRVPDTSEERALMLAVQDQFVQGYRAAPPALRAEYSLNMATLAISIAHGFLGTAAMQNWLDAAIEGLADGRHLAVREAN